MIHWVVVVFFVTGKCSNQLFFLVWVAIQKQTGAKGQLGKKTTQKAENTLVSGASLSRRGSRDTSTITSHNDAFTFDTIILYIKSVLAAAVVVVPPLLTP